MYFAKFREIYQKKPNQGPIGHLPSAYIFAAYAQNPEDVELRNASRLLLSQRQNLPDHLKSAFEPQRREAVAAICRDPNIDSTVAYCYAMAWGAQWTGGSYTDFEKSVSNLARLRKTLNQIRNLKSGGKWPNARMEAFELLNGKNTGIDGLGISYFTKVLFFFLPKANVGYVLDTYTAIAVSKLLPASETEPRISIHPEYQSLSLELPAPKKGGAKAKPYGDYLRTPTNWKTKEHYDSYCRFVEYIAKEMDWTDASDAELALFGSTVEESPGLEWRKLINPPKNGKKESGVINSSTS